MKGAGRQGTYYCGGGLRTGQGISTGNRNLFHQIVEEGGAIISEYPLGTPPLGRQFPARNRIIAGMCRGVIVVEAAERSGSLITSDFALEEGRDVFLFPAVSIFHPAKGQIN